MNNGISTASQNKQKLEWRTFFLITVVLFPVLSVMTVGGYGFFVWMMQVLFMGPPGHGG